MPKHKLSVEKHQQLINMAKELAETLEGELASLTFTDETCWYPAVAVFLTSYGGVQTVEIWRYDAVSLGFQFHVLSTLQH